MPVAAEQFRIPDMRGGGRHFVICLTPSEGRLAGEVFEMSEDRVPDTFSRCDGRALNVGDYPELFAVLGHNYD